MICSNLKVLFLFLAIFFCSGFLDTQLFQHASPKRVTEWCNFHIVVEALAQRRAA
jgi:hypothetical protein